MRKGYAKWEVSYSELALCQDPLRKGYAEYIYIYGKNEPKQACQPDSTCKLRFPSIGGRPYSSSSSSI